MNLWLNAPPSFHNPKSVLVVALPPVEKAHLPDLHAVDPKQVFCLQQTPLTLPVDGSPAIFSTNYAHELTLRLEGANGKTIDVPTRPDPTQGGFVVPAPVVQNAGLGRNVKATVQGSWGFDTYTGPSFQLRSSDGADWTVADEDKNALVVGREDELHLRSDAAACVEAITFRNAGGLEQKATWRLDGPGGVIATLPLKQAQPGAFVLAIRQYGVKEPSTLNIPSFAEAGKYDSFTIHAGDGGGVLTGSRLDEVASLQMGDRRLLPGKLTRTGNVDALEMMLAQSQGSASIAGLAGGAKSIAQVTLKDGRVVAVPVTVDEARPQVTLINKTVQPGQQQPVALKLTGQDELPLDGKLTFALKSQIPVVFARNEAIEIGTADGLASTTFSLASGQLVLQDAKTAIATLDPAKSFGTSAFGPLRLRPVMADGTAGDWVPLATLVRLPALQSYSCPPDASQPCTLAGSSLFLLDAVAADAQFTKPVVVPDGFSSGTLQVPHASGGQLFIKLRDDPVVVNTVAVEPPTHATNHRAHRLAPDPKTSPEGTADAGAGEAEDVGVSTGRVP